MNKGIQAFLGIVSVSPLLFLVGLVVSLVIYLKFPFPVVHGHASINIFMSAGILLMILGTWLAFSAQRVSRVVSRPAVKATCPDLMQGPYKHSRHPGSLALITMYLGFALITNSFILILAAALFMLLISLVFAPMEEKVIGSLCPEAYAEYKTKVRMWF